MKSLAILILASLTTTAAAEKPNNVAIATSAPFVWDQTLAASVFGGISKHHAFRANIARYSYDSGYVGLGTFKRAFLEDESSYFGHTLDVGLGWVIYPRRVLSGPMLELGALYRSRDLRERNYASDYLHTDTDSRIYAGRALVGWSWT